MHYPLARTIVAGGNTDLSPVLFLHLTYWSKLERRIKETRWVRKKMELWKNKLHVNLTCLCPKQKQNTMNLCSPPQPYFCELSCGARTSRNTSTVRDMGESWVKTKSGVPAARWAYLGGQERENTIRIRPLPWWCACGWCCDGRKGRGIEVVKRMD